MKILYGLDLVSSLEKKLRNSLRRAKKNRGMSFHIGIIGDRSADTRFFSDREATVFEALGATVDILDIKKGGNAAARRLIQRFNRDHDMIGYLLRWPLPAVTCGLFDLADLIDPAKDIDGLRIENRLNLKSASFRPGFIVALDKILKHNSIKLSGKRVCVVGRSNFTGRPLANYFLARNATVTVCHHHTKDLHRHTREAEILVLAAGSPNLIGAAHVSAGVTVIDIGTTLKDTKSGTQMIGDANSGSLDAKPGYLIPTPGGIGCLVPYMIFANALKAAAILPANLQSDLAFIKVAS